MYIATDNRKNVYSELFHNPLVELASYNLNTRKWIRISGRVEQDSSGSVREEMENLYPMIKQEYIQRDEMFFVIFKIIIEEATIA